VIWLVEVTAGGFGLEIVLQRELEPCSCTPRVLAFFLAETSVTGVDAEEVDVTTGGVESESCWILF